MSEPVKRWGADEIDAGLVGGEFVLLADHERAMAEKDAEWRSSTSAFLRESEARANKKDTELTALKAKCEGMREAAERGISLLFSAYLAGERPAEMQRIASEAIAALAALPVEGPTP